MHLCCIFRFTSQILTTYYIYIIYNQLSIIIYINYIYISFGQTLGQLWARKDSGCDIMTPFVCSEATFLTGETNIGWLTKIWCWKWPAIDGYTMVYIISPWSPIIITSHRSPFANRLATHLGGPCSRHTPKLWIWKRDSPKGLFMTWHDPFRVPHGSGTQGIVWNRVPLNPLVNDLSLSLFPPLPMKNCNWFYGGNQAVYATYYQTHPYPWFIGPMPISDA